MLQDLTDRATEGPKQSNREKHARVRDELDGSRESLGESKSKHQDRKGSRQEPIDQDQIPYADTGPKTASE